MASDATGDRSLLFPAIEKKYGRPIETFIAEVRAVPVAKYPEQVAHLRERHGFTRAEANAVVMWVRGSSTSRRFATPEEFLADLGGEREATARAILNAVGEDFPQVEAVIAWNQLMFRVGKQYVLGVSAASHHLLLGPWGGLSEAVVARAHGLQMNKKTIRVPVGWTVDRELLRVIVSEGLR